MQKEKAKNKKNIMIFGSLVIVTIVLLIGILAFKEYYNGGPKNIDDLISELKYIDELEDTSASGSEQEVDVDEKISELKRKLSTKGLIVEGDLNLENKEYATALKKYLQIYKDFPKDKEISKKIGDTFFELKNFPLSYKYYGKAKGIKDLDNKKVILALLYSKDLKILQNRQFILKELTKYDLSPEEKFYYATSMSCIEDFKKCISEFDEYIQKKGGIENIDSVKLQDLKNIFISIENFKNFQTEDDSYLDALITGTFFENKLFPISVILSRKILSDKPDYGAILRIIAKSHFELGNYNEAKNYLVIYNEKDPDEKDVIYALGISYEKLKKYVISTVHFKKALALGYEPSINLRRRIIYNFNELGNIDNILEGFDDLVNKEFENITIEDLSLAIYYNIIEGKFEVAKKYIEIALEKFPEEGRFYGYKGWILIEKGESFKVAEEVLKKGLKLDDKNPMINLLVGKLYIKNGQDRKSIVYLKKAINYDKSGNFATVAQDELDKVQ